MKKLSIAIALSTATIAMTAAPADAKPARCRIAIDDNTYNGPCNFGVGKGGSFDLSGFRKSFSIRSINVFVTRPGVGEARIIPEGGKPLWGRALRSREESACWDGDFFRICVY